MIHRSQLLSFTCSILLIIAVWQIAYIANGNDIILPSPLKVFKSLGELVCSAGFWRSLSATCLRLAISLLIVVPLGLAVGIICGLNRMAAAFFKPIFTIIAATPVMSVILIAYLAFGSERTPVFTAFLMIFPVMAANTMTAVSTIDPKYTELCNIYNFSRKQRIRHLYLYAMLPYFKAALRASLSLAWKVIVAAEVLVQPLSALGTSMQVAKANLQTTELFAWTLSTILASAVTEVLLLPRGRRLN
ncbi:ABC transporter permease [Spirochaetia bacterium]|nr:ABC transporter permease [Spirochaetia bacterium]